MRRFVVAAMTMILLAAMLLSARGEEGEMGLRVAGMRSSELQTRLRQFGAPESEIKGCIDNRDLVALHDRYQRAHSTRGTPPTVEEQSLSSCKRCLMTSQVGLV